MASDNLMISSFEQQPWQFRPTFNQTFENECLTNALYKSFTNTTTTTNSSNDKVFNDLVDSLLNNPPVVVPHTPTISGASENEVPPPKRRRSLPPPGNGKVSKRKSRASKRSTTTFITADPANFRRMVQEVTGVKFNNGETSVFKPETNRAVNQNVQVGFDTSSFLLDSYLMNDNNMVQPIRTTNGGDVGVSGFGFESFCSFPTLESWKV